MIVLMDGFDSYANSNQLTMRWNSAVNAYADTIYAYGRGKGIGFGSYTTAYLNTGVGTPLQEAIFGIWVYKNSIAYRAATMLQFLQGTTEHCSLRLTGTGLFTATRNGTVLLTSVVTMPSYQWVHLETKVKIANAPTGTFETRMNGIPILSGSGLDTQNGLDASFDTVSLSGGWGGTSSYECWYDHLYLLNSTPPNNDFLGATQILTHFPAKNGSLVEWSPGALNPNHLNIDTVINPDRFNYSASGSATDLYDFDDVPISGSILGLQINTVAKQGAGGTKNLSNTMLFSGSLVSGSAIPLTASNNIITSIYNTDPAGNQWTADNVNATEFGYKTVT